jgi:hypothetical protein
MAHMDLNRSVVVEISHFRILTVAAIARVQDVALQDVQHLFAVRFNELFRVIARNKWLVVSGLKNSEFRIPNSEPNR